jgi:hypothetical protein
MRDWGARDRPFTIDALDKADVTSAYDRRQAIPISSLRNPTKYFHAK